MTSTANAWLNELTSLFTPRANQFSAASEHRYSIESCLGNSVGVYEMFEIGSLKHGTGIRFYSDADFLVSIKGARPSSPSSVLVKVKAALQARFPNTQIGIRQPAVACYFSDGVVEVVPGYISGDGYSIPDPSGDWMKSHPKQHNKYVNKVNKQHDGGAKRLARHLKIWKYKNDVPISSCYLEMRAARHLEREPNYIQIWDLTLVLKKMLDNELAALNDPTGLNSRFSACSSETNRAIALSKLRSAATRARKATEFAIADKHFEAIKQLELLFNR